MPLPDLHTYILKQTTTTNKKRFKRNNLLINLMKQFVQNLKINATKFLLGKSV